MTCVVVTSNPNHMKLNWTFNTSLIKVPLNKVNLRHEYYKLTFFCIMISIWKTRLQNFFSEINFHKIYFDCTFAKVNCSYSNQTTGFNEAFMLKESANMRINLYFKTVIAHRVHFSALITIKILTNSTSYHQHCYSNVYITQ